MNRRVVAFLLVVSPLLVPGRALSQAWLPPKGEVFFSLTYQWLKAENHLLPASVLAPELTPLEELFGIDLQSTVDPTGKTRSHVLVLDGDIGLTDRLALSAAVAFVQAAYLGKEIDRENPEVDDGSFHGSFQDARVGVRYLALNRSSWVLTPSATLVVPTNDYPVFGHAVIGRGLRELQLGVNAGRLVRIAGAPRAYLQGSYTYALMEDVSDEVKLDRSNLEFEFGFFHRSMTVQATASYQRTHGGIDWAQDIGLHQHHFEDIVHSHDQAAAANHWRFGGALSFQVSEAVDLFVSLNDTLWGVNTHDARTVTFGLSWGFRAFGGIGPTRGPRDDDKDDREEE